eukprot:6610391-Prymnesium_polylepis.2
MGRGTAYGFQLDVAPPCVGGSPGGVVARSAAAPARPASWLAPMKRYPVRFCGAVAPRAAAAEAAVIVDVSPQALDQRAACRCCSLPTLSMANDASGFRGRERCCGAC